MVAVEANDEAPAETAWLLLPPSRGGVSERFTSACAERGKTFGLPLFSTPVVAPRAWAERYGDAITALGCRRTFVVGLSFGGQVAQALLQFRPECVAGVLLIASGAPDRARGAALRRSRWWWCWLPAARRAPRERLMASDLDGATDASAFAAVRVPVAIVELGADAVISANEAARVRALFPRAARTIVPGLGHDALATWPDALHDAVVAAMDALLSAAPAGSR